MTGTVGRRDHHGPSIRLLLAVLLGTIGLLVGALFLLTTLQLRVSNHQAKVESRRTESFLLADSMRQSSNDLTLMVRLYVSTGQPLYRDYYNEILAIRDGTAPRPVDDDSSFWDRVLAEGKDFVRYGPPSSLIARLRAARFAPDELAALQTALDTSNGLARVEREVMDAVAARAGAGAEPSTPAL